MRGSFFKKKPSHKEDSKIIKIIQKMFFFFKRLVKTSTFQKNHNNKWEKAFSEKSISESKVNASNYKLDELEEKINCFQ